MTEADDQGEGRDHGSPASEDSRDSPSQEVPRGATVGLDEEAELLRFSTAGSVDDGKSTLIGRLLYDTKTAFEDQLQHVEDVSRRRGDERVNLALLTDGLRAEREQGITIDVAYRYFATRRRKFIIADTPGHIQYTRNMVTGASTASLSIILVDARQGLVEQSRRHAFIASLLRIPHLVFAVNKMDLVDWSEDRFHAIEDEFRNFAARLDVQDIMFIPMSALTGANVVERSREMPWYHGPTLLYHLETVHIASDRNLIDVRFPVQWVIRPQSNEHHDYRGYAGQVAGGVMRSGDEVIALPSGLTTRITRIEQLGVEVDAAFPPMSVTVHLADDVDVGRGDMLCRPNNQPTVGQDLDAMVCWMTDRPLSAKGRYALKHTTRWTRAKVTEVLYRLDVNTGHRDEATRELRLNDLGRIRLRTTTPVLYDPYRRNRATGSFILVDEATNATVAAGMLLAVE
jgi:bifunctional enzyme CysN/CysC